MNDKSGIVYFLICILCGRTFGLEIIDVFLADEQTHFRLRDAKGGILQCLYSLEEGEVVSKVLWYHDDFLIYSWSPGEMPTLGEGIPENIIAKRRKDANLEFKTADMEYSGLYHCDVELTNRQKVTSHTYQLLVVDMPDYPVRSEHKIKDCVINFSWDTPAVKPKPTPICGVWSEKYGYTRTATTWQATPYHNGSISYRLEDDPFEISFMPVTAIIKCALSIRKVDHSEVLLVEKTYLFEEISEIGCAPLQVDDTIDLKYENKGLTCHKEIKAKDPSNPVVAIAKCRDHLEPKYKDLVTMVELVCETNKWNISKGLTWNHYSNLICVEKEKEYKNPVIPELPKLKERKKATPDSSGAVLAPPYVFIFILTIVASGTLWGIKIYLPRKKNTRFIN